MSRPPAITIDQLLALNEEIRALVRAGIPLETGLRALGSDLPGRLGRLAEHVSRRLEQGEGLAQILEASTESFPPAYRAVVLAGLRAGRLPLALESIALSVRQTSELRKALIVALSYPLLLALIATGVFALTLTQTVPAVREMFTLVDVARPAWYELLASAAQITMVIAPWLWLAVLVILILWWLRFSRAAYLGSGPSGWIPSLGNVRFAGRMATFAEVLAALTEQQVPLDEAVELAAAAGGGELQRSGHILAEELRRGGTSAETPRGIPPLLAWLILTSPNQPQLVRALRHAARNYRRRATRMSLVLGSYLPIFLSAAVGGFVAFYHAALTLVPFYSILYRLGQP